MNAEQVMKRFWNNDNNFWYVQEVEGESIAFHSKTCDCHVSNIDFNVEDAISVLSLDNEEAGNILSTCDKMVIWDLETNLSVTLTRKKE